MVEIIFNTTPDSRTYVKPTGAERTEMDFSNRAFCISFLGRSSSLYLMLLVIFNVYLIVTASILTDTVTDGGEGVPPKISHDVESVQTVREDTKSFVLKCPVEGKPPPIIQWRKDTETIGVTWIRYKNADTKKLKIKNVKMEDAGHYTCEAVNGFGHVDVEYTLRVIPSTGIWPPPPDPPVEIVDGTAKYPPVWANKHEIEAMTSRPMLKRIGTDIKLKCHAYGRPRPNVQWFKDGYPISVGYSDSNRWIYHLKDLSDKNAGRYTCRVYNEHGVLNATFTIKVTNGDHSAPVFFPPHPVNRTVHQGQMATFQCKVRSSVPPHIKWLKRVEDQSQVEDNSTVIKANGQNFMVLQHESKTVDERNSTYVNKLVINKVIPKDSGWYICVVTNSAGHMVYRSAYLNVEGAVEQTPLPFYLFLAPAAPLVIVIVVVLLFFLMFIVYAVVFLQKHKQKAANIQKNPPGSARPPPPTCPPPSLPYKTVNSPRRSDSNGYYPSQHRYIVRTSGGEHFRTTLGCDYRLYDAQASVPLNSSFAEDRDLYEATPQPYEIDYEHSEVEFYPKGGGRLQPHPSLYSCR